MKRTVHHKRIVGREVTENLYATSGKCKLECGYTVGGLNLGKTHIWCYVCKPPKAGQMKAKAKKAGGK